MSWRNTREYRLWRILVIRRDKVCQCCGSNKDRQAHHIEDGSHNPDVRFDVDNGITLCRGCHSQFHTNYKHSFREKTTREDLDNFLALVSYYKKLHTDTILSKVADKLNTARDEILSIGE